MGENPSSDQGHFAGHANEVFPTVFFNLMNVVDPDNDANEIVLIALTGSQLDRAKALT